MKFQHQVISMVIALWVMMPVAIYAVDQEPDLAEEQTEPEFTNPAQAQHAENLAAAAFSDKDMETAEEKATPTEEEEEAIKAEAEAKIEELAIEEYEKATGMDYDGDPENLQDYIDDLSGAYEEEYERLYQEEFDKNLADEISSITGAQLQEIYDMRYEDKMGWGVIAQELGVHPSVLGLGHGKKKGMGIEEEDIEPPEDPDTDPLTAEMMKESERNMHADWNRGAKGKKGKKGGSTQTLGLTESSTAAAAASSGGKGKGNAGQESSVGGGKNNNGKSGVSSQASSKGSGKSNGRGSSGRGNSNSNAGGNKGGGGNGRGNNK